MSSRTIVIGVVFFVSTTVTWAMAAKKSDVQPHREQITFRSVDTETGPKIEVSVGDMVFLASHITFLHDQKPNSEIRAVKGRFEWTRGMNLMSTRKMVTNLRGGALSSRSSLPDIGMIINELLNPSRAKRPKNAPAARRVKKLK